MKRYALLAGLGDGPFANRVGQDTAYLSPIVDEIEAEMAEREDLESMVVRKTKEQRAEKSK